MLRPTSGRAEIFGLDAQRDTVAAHRRLAYVGGETSLWPALTGAETLHLLGRVQGRADKAYQGELIERFALDPSRKVRGYSKRNRQKGRRAAPADRQPPAGADSCRCPHRRPGRGHCHPGRAA